MKNNFNLICQNFWVFKKVSGLIMLIPTEFASASYWNYEDLVNSTDFSSKLR